MARLPRGLNYEAAGIRIRVWRAGRLAHVETLKGPHSQALIARAKKRRDHVVECMDLGIPIEQPRTSSTFFEASQAWLNSLQVDPDTAHKYLTILESKWLPRFQDVMVRHISRAQVLEELASFGVKIKTQKNYLGPFRMVLDHAGVNPNPAAGIKWNRKKTVTEKPVIERFTPQERGAIISALDELAQEGRAEHQENKRKRYGAHWTTQARVFFPLMFATGLRPGEALALRWDNYNGQTVWVAATHTRGKRKEATKTGESRRVYVPSWMRARLEEHTTRFEAGPIFTNSRGNHLKDTKRLNKVWRDALDRCELPDRDPYACRHSRASELLSRSVPIAEAADQLGHDTSVFLDVYAEWIEEYAGERDYSHLEGATVELPSSERPAGEVIPLKTTP